MSFSVRDFFFACSEGPEWLFTTKKHPQNAHSHEHQHRRGVLITKARVIWSLLHLFLLHFLLSFGNKTNANVPFPTAKEQTLFLSAIVLNALAYFVVSFSSPGFVMQPIMGAFPSSSSSSSSSSLMKMFARSSTSSTRALSEKEKAKEEDNSIRLFSPERDDAEDAEDEENGGGNDTTTVNRECVHCQPPVFQPIRAKHCFACNRCVRKFDHHCHWISNCVGEKNHGKFLVFLTTQFIVVAWGLLACTRTFEYYSSSSSSSSSSRSHRKPSSMAELVANNGWSCFATLVFFILTVFVGALFFTHWYLILSARTTYELLAPRRKVWYLPQRGGGGGGGGGGRHQQNHHREFTRSPFTYGTGCHGAFMNLKRTVCIDSTLPNDMGVKWVVPTERALAEREAEETCLENSTYSCC